MLAGRHQDGRRFPHCNTIDRRSAFGSDSKQTIFTAGLNWYVNRNVRFMLNYLHGWLDKPVSATNLADAGSQFDAVATRMQIAW